MSDTPGAQKRPISAQSELSSNNDEQDAKRTRVDSSLNITGMDTTDLELSGISLPYNESQTSLNNVNLEQSSQILTPSMNNNNINNNNQTISLQLPDLTPGGSQSAILNSNEVDATTKDELQKGPAPADPDKLADALLSSGVDLKAEELLLTQNQLVPPSILNGVNPFLSQNLVQLDPFLDQRNLTSYINKIIAANKLKQINSSIEEEKQILELMTAACEEWMKGILTNTVIIARHRKRSTNKSNKKRSEVSKALRELALKDKTQEDNRNERKKKLGLSNDGVEKEGSEEIQHKATNATVAMMTAGKKKKKYSWMTGGSGAGGSGGAGKAGASGFNPNDQTIRFREAREEQGIAVRDLLSSLEKKRMGVDKTLVKGYAKLKD